MILDIATYKGGASRVEGAVRTLKLSANETPLGPSPKALAAAHGSLAEMHRYPDGRAVALREALARRHGTTASRIALGNGSGELISLLIQAYCGPGDEVVFPVHAFLMFEICALSHGVKPVTAPEKDLTADVDALLARVGPRTRAVLVANPNNPTGTYLPAAEIARLRAGLAGDVLLVVDSAYAEYADFDDYDAGAQLAASRDDTVMLRTFSKIYGLAALRVGWAIAPEATVDLVDRIRGPFNVNGPGQAAALAALEDGDWLKAAKSHNAIWRTRLALEIGALGLITAPSAANFILIRFPGPPRDAAAAEAFLLARGIILRDVASYGLPDCLRLTIGTEAENRTVIEALSDFMRP
jgi:histidinol-phosphate aminotransferase